LLTLQVFADTA